MKIKLFLLASPILLLAACNGPSNKADKQKADSLAAVTHMDSLMNASKMMHKQDSIAAIKAADSTKKADSAKGQK